MSSKLLDVPVHSLKAIANKHKVTQDYIHRQLRRGTDIEHEHTTHRRVAERIALAHLNERADYYQRLKKVEKKGKRS